MRLTALLLSIKTPLHQAPSWTQEGRDFAAQARAALIAKHRL